MAFSDIMPLAASLGVTQPQAETYFSNVPEPPAPPTPPNITKTKYVAVANIVFDGVPSIRKGVEKAGGMRAIAEQVGLWESQVKQILKELDAGYAAYLEQNNP